MVLLPADGLQFASFAFVVGVLFGFAVTLTDGFSRLPSIKKRPRRIGKPELALMRAATERMKLEVVFWKDFLELLLVLVVLQVLSSSINDPLATLLTIALRGLIVVFCVAHFTPKIAAKVVGKRRFFAIPLAIGFIFYSSFLATEVGMNVAEQIAKSQMAQSRPR